MPAAAINAIQTPIPNFGDTKSGALSVPDAVMNIITDSRASTPQSRAINHVGPLSATVFLPASAITAAATKQAKVRMPQLWKPFTWTVKPKVLAENHGSRTEIMPMAAKTNIKLRCLFIE